MQRVLISCTGNCWRILFLVSPTEKRRRILHPRTLPAAYIKRPTPRERRGGKQKNTPPPGCRYARREKERKERGEKKTASDCHANRRTHDKLLRHHISILNVLYPDGSTLRNSVLLNFKGETHLVGCRERSHEPYAPRQAYPAGEIF
jgi:hypothetical protein